MKILVLLLSVAGILLHGCAGRQANPISCYVPGDENLNCDSLKKEILQLQSDMLNLLPKTDKTFTNSLWVAGGAVAIVPYFFVDAKDAERIEYEAFRRRHNRLLLIAEQKECDFSDIKAEPIPTLEHRKVMSKEAKQKEKVSE